jgi:hypothetical protein
MLIGSQVLAGDDFLVSHNDLNAAILLASGIRFVAGDRLRFTESSDFETGARNATLL